MAVKNLRFILFIYTLYDLFIYSLVESDQKTLKVGIPSFLA